MACDYEDVARVWLGAELVALGRQQRAAHSEQFGSGGCERAGRQ